VKARKKFLDSLRKVLIDAKDTNPKKRGFLGKPAVSKVVKKY